MLAAFAALLAAAGLACAPGAEISFYREGAVLYVGESRDLMPYLVFSPATAVDVPIFEADGDSVTVSGSVVTAVSEGRSVVTATLGQSRARFVLDVSYRAANNLAISAVGETVQTVKDGKPRSVAFSAALDAYADPAAEIVWTVNGKKSGVGATFEFAPPGYGEYEVEAQACGLSDVRTVRVYRESEAYAYFSGELEQSRSFSPLRFFVEENVDTRNPRSAVEWRVNGVPASTARVFLFTPERAGEYEISASVNGVTAAFESGDSVTVTARGERAPDVTEIEITADGVFIRWADDKNVRALEITAPDGTRRVYEFSDARYESRFRAGRFDATELIEPCSNDPGTYTVRLTADGRGEPYEFMQYGAQAARYISETVLCGNCFISDEERAHDYITELYLCGRTVGECYVARGVDGAERAMKDAAAAIGAEIELSANDGVISVWLSYKAAEPTAGEHVTVGELYSVLPHIEYDERARRADSYVFALDRASKTATVTTGDQLLFVAAKGIKPSPVRGSDAAAVYDRAKRVLRSIIGASYTDAQKVHAIYDWLQWNTAHAAADDGNCGYLERVFGGAMYSPSGVTDSLGTAKAVLLMCAVEGIECSIERDEVGYYAVVTLGGVPYVADAYGGEETGVSGIGERASHAGLFLPSSRGVFDAGELYYLQKGIRDGVYYDYYIDASECDDYAHIKAAVYGAFSTQSRKEFDVIGVNSITTMINNSLGAEFALGAGVDADATGKLLRKAAGEYLKEIFGKTATDAELSSAVRFYAPHGVAHVIVHIPNA